MPIVGSVSLPEAVWVVVSGQQFGAGMESWIEGSMPKVPDSGASTILAILAATFMFTRRIIIQKPEQAFNVWRVVSVAQFVLLLIIVQLRWKIWTGQSPWQLQSGALILITVGFLIFALTIIHWLIKRN